MTTNAKGKSSVVSIEALFREDRDLFKRLLKESLQEVLEAEMTEALAAAPGERSPERLGYRAGYYGRSLITRIGKLELRVPRDREGLRALPALREGAGGRRQLSCPPALTQPICYPC